MNIQLDPPRVPPLDPAQRSQLRNRVMDKSMPARDHSTRRWAAPLVAVGAVAAVVAGTLAVTHHDVDPGVAGTTTAATPTASRPSLAVVPDAEAVAAFEKSCHSDGQLKAPLTVVWARRVPSMTAKGTDILMIIKGSGASGIANCLAPGGSGGWAKTPPPAWTELPTRQKGLVGLFGGESSISAPKPESRVWMLYRARPEIARIESRLVWKGTAGPWQPGYVDNGYAYAASRINVAVDFIKGGDRQELRAYDAQGRLIPIEPK